MRALIVEDDPVSARLIDTALKGEGIISEAVRSGQDATNLAKHYDFDVVVLNFRLPDVEAPEMVRRLRAANVRIPVLIVSASNKTDDKVRSLAAGADDYLTMPFHKDELIARIHAIVRRSQDQLDMVIKTGKLAVNLSTRSVDVDGRRLHVTGKEYSILELLSLRKGTTLTKEMFLDHLYGGIDEPELKIIDIFIAKLRKKIAAENAGDHYIETVWGSGYVLKDPENGSAAHPTISELDFQREVLEALDILNRAKHPSVPKLKSLEARHARVFLAHAREDKNRVRELYEKLSSAGYDPWLDEIDLLPGQNWKIEIQNAIRDAGVFVACLSHHSVAKQGYVQTEFRTALRAYSERPPGTIYLIPIKFDECEVPDIQVPDHGTTMRDIQWVELWDDRGIERLIEAIKRGLATSSSKN